MNSSSNLPMTVNSTGCKQILTPRDDAFLNYYLFSLPGVPATHRKVEAPFTAVVNIRGDRLYHEHISWDQGTVLRQLGLLPEYLPFPYAVPENRKTGAGTLYEYKVPVAGLDVAMKMRDRNSIPSNQMFDYKPREKTE
jgi:carboxymethylenebutenolidase